MSQPDAAEAMWAAATSVGFFTVTNHGVPDELIENAFASSKQFFARDLDAKQRESPFAPQLNSGFEYFSQVRPSTGTADQKESLQITARAGAMDDRWPSEPETLQPVARAMMEASRALAARILDMLEPRACPNLAPGTLQRSHTLWGAGGQCTLRLLHYPPTAPPELAAVEHPVALASAQPGPRVAGRDQHAAPLPLHLDDAPVELGAERVGALERVVEEQDGRIGEQGLGGADEPPEQVKLLEQEGAGGGGCAEGGGGVEGRHGRCCCSVLLRCCCCALAAQMQMLLALLLRA